MASFICRIRCDTLSVILKGLEGLRSSVIITAIQDEGWRGYAQDDSAVALANWNLSERAFEDFRFMGKIVEERERVIQANQNNQNSNIPKLQISWKISVPKLLRLIAAAKPDDLIEIFSPEADLGVSPAWLGIHYQRGINSGGCGFHARLPLDKLKEEEIAGVNKMRINKVFFENKVVIRSRTFENIVKQLQQVAPHVKLFVDPRHFEFHVENPVDGTCGKQSLARFGEEKNFSKYSSSKLNSSSSDSISEKKFDEKINNKLLGVGSGDVEMKDQEEEEEEDVDVDDYQSPEDIMNNESESAMRKTNLADYHDFTTDWADLRCCKVTIEQKFPLRFLQVFTAISPAFPVIELFFSKTQALVVSYNFDTSYSVWGSNKNNSENGNTALLDFDERMNQNQNSTNKTNNNDAIAGDSTLGRISYFISPMFTDDGKKMDEVAPRKR